MKTHKQELSEKAMTYGLKALSNEELANFVGYKGNLDELFGSQFFKAAKELVRRNEVKDIVKIKSSQDSYNLFSHLEGLNHEQFWCVYLKRNNAIIKDEFISKGGGSSTVVDTKIVLKTAINLNASGIILCHNHPSGEIRPSSADVQFTKQIKAAAELIDLMVFDHLIIGNGNFYSFADEGMM